MFLKRLAKYNITLPNHIICLSIKRKKLQFLLFDEYYWSDKKSIKYYTNDSGDFKA